NGQTHGRRNQPMRFVGGVVIHDRVDDLARGEHLEPILDGDDLTTGREDRADAHNIELGDPGVAERKLKGGKLFAMFADTLGKKNRFANWPHRLSSVPRLQSTCAGDTMTQTYRARLPCDRLSTTSELFETSSRKRNAQESFGSKEHLRQ